MIGSMRLAAVTAVLVLGCSGAQAHNIAGAHAASGSGGGLVIAANSTAASVGTGIAYGIGTGLIEITCAYARDFAPGEHQFLASGLVGFTTWYINIIDLPGGDEVAYSTVPAGTGECNADLTPTTPVPAGSFSVVG